MSTAYKTWVHGSYLNMHLHAVSRHLDREHSCKKIHAVELMAGMPRNDETIIHTAYNGDVIWHRTDGGLEHLPVPF